MESRVRYYVDRTFVVMKAKTAHRLFLSNEFLLILMDCLPESRYFSTVVQVDVSQRYRKRTDARFQIGTCRSWNEESDHDCRAFN